jgi:amidase
VGRVVITEENTFFAFDPSISPAATVDSGDTVVFHTKDCFSNQLLSEEQLVTTIDFSRVNPATGPVYVRGAEPGDSLLVDILSIETADRGFIVTAPGAGALGDLVKQAKTRACYVRGGNVEFRGLTLKANKMIGVIGVATSERTPTGTPGRHGGNLDTKLITEGARVILPVEFTGALLGIGDLHAAMGDGEICVAACEVPGKVEAKVGVAKGLRVPWPVVETADAFYILVSHEDLSQAVKEASMVAVQVLEKGLGLEWHDAYMLASLAVDLQISQVVDQRKTVRARIPKSLVSWERLTKAFSR